MTNITNNNLISFINDNENRFGCVSKGYNQQRTPVYVYCFDALETNYPCLNYMPYDVNKLQSIVDQHHLTTIQELETHLNDCILQGGWVID